MNRYISDIVLSWWFLADTVLNHYIFFYYFKEAIVNLFVGWDGGFLVEGWGILPSESVKAMARRNEMIQRQHTAR